MPEIKGIVLECSGERIRLKVNQEESTRRNLPKYLDCWNPIGAKAGQTVSVRMEALDEKKAKMIAYGIPLLCLVAGAAFGNSMAIFFKWERLYAIGGGAVLWFFIGYTYSGIFKRDAIRDGEQPVVTDIIYE